MQYRVTRKTPPNRPLETSTGTIRRAYVDIITGEPQFQDKFDSGAAGPAYKTYKQGKHH